MRRFLSAACLLAIACSGPVWVNPTAAGARVRVTNNQEIVRGCEFLGNVAGTGFYGPDEAIAIMQNETAELGGNVVFVTYQGSGRNQNARGEAYRCADVPQARPRETSSLSWCFWPPSRSAARHV